MKRIQEKSPVAGYQLFRYARVKPDGELLVSPKYYIRHRGKDVCTETDRLPQAKAFVKKRAGEDTQKWRRYKTQPESVAIGTLLDLVIDDYKASENKSLKDVMGKIQHSLRPFFGDRVAARLDTDDMDEWKKWRRSHRLHGTSRNGQEKLMPASINREISLLRRAYQLGYEHKPQLVDKIPPVFKKFAENNIRKGFVTPEQYRALMAELPNHLRPITCIAFHVANRKGELFRLEWADVDLQGDPPVFTLWPGETKNNDGRTLPILAGEMFDTLRELKAEHDEKWVKQKKVFVTSDGKPLQYHHMRDDWNEACKRAGLPGLLFHDLRRSAVRNLRRAGVTQKVAREFSGHKTDAVFDRYNISDFDDLRDAAAKLGKFLGKGRGQ
jgi:integrase